VALFSQVSELNMQIISQINQSSTFPFYSTSLPAIALLDASLIVDLFQVKVAVNMALLNAARACLKTGDIARDVLYAFSPSKHVSSA
jgi:hypothetical protein